jgi:hypothetical protein
VKGLNEYSSNEFHRWQRNNLPTSVVIQDIDAWLIFVEEQDRPKVLLELKRSFIPPQSWTPFEADAPNYRALIRLAQRASLPLRVVYWQKGIEFVEDTPIAIWTPALDYEGVVRHEGPRMATPAVIRGWFS